MLTVGEIARRLGVPSYRVDYRFLLSEILNWVDQCAGQPVPALIGRQGRNEQE